MTQSYAIMLYMNATVNKFKGFLDELRFDDRFPKKDQRKVLILLALVISPIDFIPDWIPLYGILDDVLYLALVCDYLFDILDQEILLSHYPWGMKSFSRIRRIGRFFSFFAPSFVSDGLWSFKKNPF